MQAQKSESTVLAKTHLLHMQKWQCFVSILLYGKVSSCQVSGELRNLDFSSLHAHRIRVSNLNKNKISVAWHLYCLTVQRPDFKDSVPRWGMRTRCVNGLRGLPKVCSLPKMLRSLGKNPFRHKGITPTKSAEVRYARHISCRSQEILTCPQAGKSFLSITYSAAYAPEKSLEKWFFPLP